MRDPIIVLMEMESGAIVEAMGRDGSPHIYVLERLFADDLFMVGIAPANTLYGRALEAFSALKKLGFVILAASQHGTLDLYRGSLPERMVLVFGSESTGLSKDIVRAADDTVRIPGTGHVESLNVACASTALLSEYWRQHPRT